MLTLAGELPRLGDRLGDPQGPAGSKLSVSSDMLLGICLDGPPVLTQKLGPLLNPRERVRSRRPESADCGLTMN